MASELDHSPAGTARPAVLAAGAGCLLIGPTALAFFSGGYFSEAQGWAGLAAWALFGLAALVGARPLPVRVESRLALVGLVGLGAWTLASISWAPVAGSAYAAGQLTFVYVGALLASVALLRRRAVQRMVEPVLAAGTVIVIGYGLSERFLPGLLHFSRSVGAEGRLEQPLTYWNAMGEMAAIGLVLTIRLAGTWLRPRWMRLAAAVACAPLGMGLYLSFSRGALFACGAGVIVLVVAAPRREALRSGALGLAAAALGALDAVPWHAVTSLSGHLGMRERQGAYALAGLLVVMAVAGGLQWRLTGHETRGKLRLPRHAGVIAAGLVCVALALAIVTGAKGGSSAPLSAGANRLVSLQSDRYAYWRVALRAFADEPIHGVGAGGWTVWWLRYRPFDEFAQDAHSLELQTLAELGVVGVLFLALWLGATALAAVRAQRLVPALAAGPIAGVMTYIAHSPLDWDWQMPAVTLIAIVLAGLVMALADAPEPVAGAVPTDDRDLVSALP